MFNRDLKIGYLSSESPLNKRVWSGTHYSIFKSLEQFGEVIILGPYRPGLQFFTGRIINGISLKLFGKRFDYRHSFFVSKAYGKYFSRKIRRLKPDIIIAPAASSELAFLKCEIPVYYITDGTFDCCLNYHKSLSNLFNFNISQGNEIEKKAIEKSRYTIVSSEWAARSVIRDYSTSEKKVKIIPFGANFEKLPIKIIEDKIIPKEWKILFIGVYWDNKGGEIAFNAFKILADNGFPVSLTVLGCIPPVNFSHPKLNVVPFIDKNTPEGQQILSEIFLTHHFLVLPTRFDCTPIVINEASAFAIPSLVANTGGVAGHLKDGVNGYLINYNDLGEGYAQKIRELIQSPELYFKMRENSRKLYEEFLNWTHWKNELQALINS